MKIEQGRMMNDYIEPNRRQYCIPVFQRDYAWTTEQCRKLFDDIIEAYRKNRQHFCGSFVYAPLETKNFIDYYIIIDGQQRYTTLYILLKALLDISEDVTEKEAFQAYLMNEDKFHRYNDDEKSKLKLKPVKTDNNQLVLLMEDKYDDMNKSKDGIIYRNYMLFREWVNDFLKEDPHNSLRMILDGMQQLVCADIRLGPEDNAQEIFERINSTGIKLSLSDLIRNYVLMTDTNQEELYEKYWLKTQELLTNQVMDSFFMDYLHFKLEGFAKESEAYNQFKYVFIKGEYTNETMLKEILHYAELYHIFLKGGDDSLNADVNNALTGLRQLNQTTVYLFLFSLFDDFLEGIIDDKTLAKVLQLLLNYSIRRLICEVGSNSLRGLYKTLYQRVFDKEENKNHYYDAIISFLQQMTSKDVFPDDSSFIGALKYNNLYRKNALCKYLLASIENKGKAKVVIDNLTIEHILPQNMNLSDEWRNMLGKDQWELVREKYLHTLGNLSLTAYNSELGDKPFDEKRAMLNQPGSHITVLNENVLDKEVWNAETIEARADRLAELILGLFPTEGPEIKIDYNDPNYKVYTAVNPKDATNKIPQYYELLGERVLVNSFAAMVKSVASKLYVKDSSVIEKIAANDEYLPSWQSVLLSYDKEKVKNPYKLNDESEIYISTGYSSENCIWFIRGLLLKYDLSIEEDFVYSAK